MCYYPPLAAFICIQAMTTAVHFDQQERVVVEFQPDRVASEKSYLQYLGEVPETKQMASCFRMEIEQMRPNMPVVSYATTTFDNELSVFIEPTSIVFICCNDTTFEIVSPYEIRLLEWNSFCWSINLVDRTYLLVVNGIVITRQKGDFLMEVQNPKISGKGMLFIGQDQDAYGGNFNSFQTIRGKLADYHLFSHTLSESEMIDFTTCATNFFQSSSKAFLNFRDIENSFKRQNIKIYKQIDFSNSYCVRGIRRIILTEPRIAEDAVKTCEMLGGNIISPKNEEENNVLFELVSKYSNVCFKSNADILWLGMRYNKTRESLIFIDSQKAVVYKNFFSKSETSVDEPCVSFYGIKEDISHRWGKWEDTECYRDKCTPCEFNKVKFLKLRGLCNNSYFDRKFYVVNDNGTTFFLGDRYSVISKMAPTKKAPNGFGYWELKRFDLPDVRASTRLRFLSDLPTGNHVWAIENDRCGKTEAHFVLTICGDGEFSCSDGSCIALSKRCNLQINCPDASDEDDCSPIILPRKYSAKISPPRDSPDSPIKITIKTDIYSIREFKLSEFKVVAEAVITTSWIDKRVSFQNLKESATLNNIEVGAVRPWTPKLQYIGEGNTTCDIIERDFSLLVDKLNTPVPDDDKNYNEDEIFRGSENPLIMITKVTISSICKFDLVYFPFDVQRCNLIITMSDTTSGYAVLVSNPWSVRFLGERKLTEYYVSSIKSRSCEKDWFSCLEIELIFHNLFNYYITSTFVPTTILLFIGSSTFFFPIGDFNDRIMVALTSLLVEATLFNQVGETVPKTAYLKFIDIWFVFCILDLFMTNITLTLINYLYNHPSNNWHDEDMLHSHSSSSLKGNSTNVTPEHKIPYKNRKQKALYVNYMMQIACPIIVIVFVTVYFLVGAYRLSY